MIWLESQDAGVKVGVGRILTAKYNSIKCRPKGRLSFDIKIVKIGRVIFIMGVPRQKSGGKVSQHFYPSVQWPPQTRSDFQSVKLSCI